MRSVEFVPNRSLGHDDLNKAAEILDGTVNMITSPENPLGMPGIDPVMALYILTRRLNAVPVPHITPRDKNSLFITSQVLTAMKFGISSFLVIGGDRISQNFSSKEVREIDVLGTISAIKGGKQYFRKDHIPDHDSLVGAALNPFRSNEEEIVGAKISSGADFFISQAIYDSHHLSKDWIKNRNFKLIAGFIPLRKRSQVEFAEKLHISISDSARERLLSSEDLPSESFRLITEIIDDLKGYVDGIHIMPMGNYKTAKEILETV